MVVVMARGVVIGFFAIVGVLIGGNLLVAYSIKRQSEPYFRAQTAAATHQSVILDAGVLDSVERSSDEGHRLDLLTGAMDTQALDVRKAPLVLERARVVDEFIAVDMRSAGRDGMVGTGDDVVILVSWVKTDGSWHTHTRWAIEQHGKRTEIDLKTGQEMDSKR
jgi:hypothetical protein